MNRFDCLTRLAATSTDMLTVTNLANTATEWHACAGAEDSLFAVGMGMVTPYALGLALAQPSRRVVALDGDGGIFFDPSVFGTIAGADTRNLQVIVFDNGGYISTGPLPDVGSLSLQGVEIEALARAYGVTDCTTVTDLDAFEAAIRADTQVIVAKVDTSQAFVGPLEMDLKENKYRFIRRIEETSGLKIMKPSAKEHGAPPPADPDSASVAAGDAFGKVLHEGLREAGFDFAIGLPCSGFSGAQALLAADPEVTYIPVAHEGTGLGICAGAWLGGLRPAALIENFGLMAGVYHLLRGHFSYGIPTLVLTEYRGDTGDQEFFAEGGEVTLDLLSAMRMNHRVVPDTAMLKPAIRDADRWMKACLRPFALVPNFDLTRKRG